MPVRVSRFPILVLCAVVSCSAPVMPGDVFSLTGSPKDYVSREKERRCAWRAPGGTRKVIRLSLPSSGSGGPGRAALRLGVLPRGAPDTKVDVDIRVGNERLTSYTVDQPMEWTDRRFELAAWDPANAECVISCQSDRDFWIGPCEIVTDAVSPPNVLIVLFDALRPDHLGCYGYGRNTSPEIDALARDSVLCIDAIAQASWTRPSVASLLTSCYPSTHGALDRQHVMRPNLPSLVQALKDVGYETHCFMTNPSCLPIWGIGTDFDRFMDLVGPTGVKMDDARVMDAMVASMRYAEGRPWFMFAHLLGTHIPYNAPSPFNTMFRSPDTEAATQESEKQKLIDSYDEEIAYSDSQIGRLVNELRSSGLYDNTLIILTADHGEEFNEHGVCAHGESLYNEELHVPLVMKLPRSDHAGLRYEDILELVDVAPTILDIVGAPAQPRFQGRSFLPGIRGQGAAKKFAYASLYLEAKSMYMAQTKEAKYIHDVAAREKMWFNLKQDPQEQHPLKQPIPEARELEEYAAHITTLDAEGLNILITPGGAEVNVVSGVVQGKGVAEGKINYHADCGEVCDEEGRVAFTIRFGQGRNFRLGADRWFDTVEQDSARLHMRVDPDSELSLRIEADGKPVPPSSIFLGEAAAGVHPSNDATFKPSLLAADTYTFDPLLLARRFAVYVWYVPGVKEIKDDDLTQEVREALQGLGYLK